MILHSLKMDFYYKSNVFTHLVKAMVFPVVVYGCESWTVNKVQRRRTNAFELWCWRRLLRVPWTVRRSNQSILREISPGCSLEGMMLMRCLFFSCSHNSPAGLCFKILTCVITLIGFLQFFLNSLFPYWYFPGSTSQIDCLQSKTHFSVNF